MQAPRSTTSSPAARCGGISTSRSCAARVCRPMRSERSMSSRSSSSSSSGRNVRGGATSQHAGPSSQCGRTRVATETTRSGSSMDGSMEDEAAGSVASTSGSDDSSPLFAATDFLTGSLSAEMSSDEGGKRDGGHGAAVGVSSPAVAAASLVGIGVLLGGGYLLKDQIKDFLDFFISAVDEWGPWGYAAYAGVYTALEVLAVPAIPLTMTAGIIFGPVPGTVVTSLSGTAAATIAFLIARYAARDKVLAIAQRNKRFAAIDRAIGQDGFKFVTLLRLSPLLPLAASNYLYGLTAVELGPYVAGSFIGMLPGTYAYVSAGHVGKAVLTEGEGSLSPELWQVGLGLGVTLIALGFVGNLAKQALDEVEAETDSK